ncbi:MBL fold metallo-hydrolase [Conexibacter sp. W3-3-2]|uniref:MBL fold metallo-hydrolase n=1 Tax=Conexibacter sp. W3-3-2 TaxID=2675227 RepID=UPI0018AC009E|nr:MBL fold metallo-hydrolase [Conexibacter sp. W3-3-2]
MLPPWLRVLPGRTPSATVALVLGRAPVLVDAGSGRVASRAAIDRLLADAGLRPGDLTAVLLTHAHDDHVGGVGRLAREHGVPVALHAADLDHRCDRAFLAFDVPPFPVDRVLADGDVLAAGDRELHVVHVGGQTPGAVVYWEPVDRIALTGDLVQDGDVAWARFHEPGGVAAMAAAVHRVAALDPRIVVPGHGPVVTDVPAAIARSLDRYAAWEHDLPAAARHAGRRAVVHTLVHAPRDAAALARLPWARHVAATVGLPVEGAVDELVAGLAARGIVRERDGLLHATVPAEPADPAG